MKAKELANKMRECGEGTFTPAIDGVTYGFIMSDDDSVEIVDMYSEIENPRSEKFDTVEESLEKFIVKGNPLSSYELDAFMLCKC